MRFFALEKLINLHDDYARRFKIDALQLLLVQRQGRLHLLDSNCPHREQPFDVAMIGSSDVECPVHGYRFSLLDGRVLRSTEEPCRALRVYALAYEGNEVGVVLNDIDGVATLEPL